MDEQKVTEEAAATNTSQPALEVVRLGGGEEDAKIEIRRQDGTSTRYTIQLIRAETPYTGENKRDEFVAFIVPLGREDDWIFCSEEGHQIMLQNCRVDRAAIITLHDGQEYPDFRGIKKEIEDIVLGLAPSGHLDREKRVTFLTIPPALKVENRTVLKREMTKAGECSVENVVEGVEYYRRLIFSNSGQSIQSELTLKKVNVEGEVVEDVNLNFMTWDLYILMNVGISLALSRCQKSLYEIALLGLGGGVMASFIRKCFENVRITAVEIDEKVFQLAKEYFGLKPDERLSVVIEDGLVFLAEAVKKGIKYDAVLLDVDTADQKVAMSCPPSEFLGAQVLNDVLCCLNENGLFLVNFVCRSLALRKEIFGRLRSTFGGVASVAIRDDVNELIIAWKNEDGTIGEEDVKKAARDFYARAKEHEVELLYDDVASLCRLVENLKS